MLTPRNTTPGYRVVTTDYFRVMGTPITVGRDFDAGDAKSGAAIVNWTLAAKLWPFESPVGHLIKLGSVASKAPWIRVVGVAGSSVRPLARTQHRTRHRISPWCGAPGCMGAEVVIRTSDGNPAGKGALYHALRAAVPVGIVTEPRAVSDQYEANLSTEWLFTMLFGLFGFFALSLATVGVYGVLNYAVGQRMREFAMRIALGALTPDVFRIVMRDATTMVFAGTGIGALFGLGLSLLTSAMMFHVRTPGVDVMSLVYAEAILMGVSLLACVGPARRAAHANLLQLMRAT